MRQIHSLESYEDTPLIGLKGKQVSHPRHDPFYQIVVARLWTWLTGKKQHGW